MGTKIFVGNISFDSTEQDLQELFSADGRQVERVSVITDRDTGRPRGFAFVEMANASDASAAISALDGHELHGRALRVNEAHDKPRGGGGGGGGGRGGGGGGYGGGGGRRY
jgi:RNA recognition motif-containing protein